MFTSNSKLCLALQLIPVLLIALCLPARPQGVIAQDAINMAKQAEQMGKEKNCVGNPEQLFKQALDLAEGSERYAYLTVSDKFGSFLVSRMRYEEAKKLYEKQLGVARIVDDKVWIANSLVSLANMDRKLHTTSKITVSRLQSALKMAKDTSEEKYVRRELCYALALFGQIDEAEALIRENLKAPSTDGGDYAELAILEIFRKNYPKSLETLLLANRYAGTKGSFWKLYIDAVRDADATSQNWGSLQSKAASLLSAEKFDDLESLGAQLRKETAVNPKGYRRIYGFYEGLALVDKSDKGTSRVDCLTQWSKAKPNSTLPLTALSSAIASIGWSARGSGFADTVSDEQWKKLDRQLTESSEILKKAKALGPVDEHWYGVMMESGLSGRQLTKSQYNAIFDEGTKQFPLAQEIYFDRSYYLQPRWHGAPGEFEKWFNGACDKIGGAAGDKMYARVVWQLDSNYMYPNIFQSLPGLSWERVKRGMNLLKKEYPDGLSLRAELAKLASLNNDTAALTSAYNG